MVVPRKTDYDQLIRQVPEGSIVTTQELQQKIAKQYGTEIACPLTSGIFTNIAAWASYQRGSDITLPEYPTLQKQKLEAEGFTVIERRGKFFVKDFEEKLFTF